MCARPGRSAIQHAVREDQGIIIWLKFCLELLISTFIKFKCVFVGLLVFFLPCTVHVICVNIVYVDSASGVHPACVMMRSHKRKTLDGKATISGQWM